MSQMNASWGPHCWPYSAKLALSPALCRLARGIVTFKQSQDVSVDDTLGVGL